MPFWDFKCDRCGYTCTLHFQTHEQAVRVENAVHEEGNCGGRFQRQPGAANFTISGFNAKNGYSGGGR